MFRKKKRIIDPIFGEINYMCNWQTIEKLNFTLWGKMSRFYVCATAESEKDAISDIQRKAYEDFKNSKSLIEAKAETVLKEHFPELSESELAERFTPVEIIFTRNGGFGLLIDDNEDEDCAVQPDTGFAIEFGSEVKFYDSQEQYLVFLY